MRRALFAVAAIVVAAAVVGCGRRARVDDYDEYEWYYDVYGEEYQAYSGSTDLSLEVDPIIYEMPATRDHGTDRIRGLAKVIDWQNVSTLRGTTYAAGNVEVDAIWRDDAEDYHGVRIRLKSRTKAPVNVEWRIEFYAQNGERLIGLNDTLGEETVWSKASLEGLHYYTATNTCRIKGAVGFRLFLRAAGTTGDGAPDAGQMKTDESIDRLRKAMGLH